MQSRQRSSAQQGGALICQVRLQLTGSCLTLCDPMDYAVHGILQARILEWVAFPFSRGIIPTQGSNPGLLHCRRILYQLSHQGSPTCQESKLNLPPYTKRRWWMGRNSAQKQQAKSAVHSLLSVWRAWYGKSSGTLLISHDSMVFCSF